VCPSCYQGYELKTFKTRPKKTLVDDSYHALLNRILDGSVPALMLLERSEQWEVRSLTSIHHLFLTPNVVQERRPLSVSARRAGWIGCNIRLDLIAPDAYVEVVHEGRLNPPEWVRERFQRSGKLKQIEPESRGWATLALRIIRSLNQETFSLDSLYAKEHVLQSVYPKNKNIRPKLRQQLQVLRDLGYLEFKGGGTYRLLT
jgi:type II restriction enzyme